MTTAVCGLASAIPATRLSCIITCLAIFLRKRSPGARLSARQLPPTRPCLPRARTRRFRARFIRAWKKQVLAKRPVLRLDLGPFPFARGPCLPLVAKHYPPAPHLKRRFRSNSSASSSREVHVRELQEINAD